MRRHGSYFVVFLFLLLASLILFAIFRGQQPRQNTGILERLFIPVQRGVQSFHFGSESSDVKKLQEENARLRKQIVDQSALQSEVKALQDQYQKSPVGTQKLLPANIIGRRGFVPGITVPDEITIAKGQKDGVIKGQVVIYQDNVVGRVRSTSDHISMVDLIWNPKFILTGETVKTKAPGIIQGAGKGFMNLANVLLAEKLEVKDLVITKGDVDAAGAGFPPGLTVGRVVSVDKRPSSLFQVAGVESLVSIADLPMVFVITH